MMWQKYGTAGQVTDHNTAHALCMLDTEGYKHSLRLFNTYCFSTTTVVARTCLNVTLYVQYLDCVVKALLRRVLDQAHPSIDQVAYMGA